MSILYLWTNLSFRFLTPSLRLALLNEAKEVRAAGLRSLRYLIRDTAVLQKVLKLQVDYLIARWVPSLTWWKRLSGCYFIWPREVIYFVQRFASSFEMLFFSCPHIFLSAYWLQLKNRRTWLITFLCLFRCIDIQQSNEGERTQALRLVRKVR